MLLLGLLKYDASSDYGTDFHFDSKPLPHRCPREGTELRGCPSGYVTGWLRNLWGMFGVLEWQGGHKRALTSWEGGVAGNKKPPAIGFCFINQVGTEGLLGI